MCKFCDEHNSKFTHQAQVIPLEEAEQVIDIVNAIEVLPCVCWRMTRGKKNSPFCLGLGYVASSQFSEYPEYEENAQALTKNEAKQLLRRFDQSGLVHSIWSMDTPFVNGMCNCNAPECLPVRNVEPIAIKRLFQSKYYCRIQRKKCLGCRECQKKCSFGAVSYSLKLNKCTINKKACYGCGVCRSSCKSSAIDLTDRHRISFFQKGVRKL